MKHSISEILVKAIHRRSIRKYAAEENIRIKLKGFRGKESVGELFRRESIISVRCVINTAI